MFQCSLINSITPHRSLRSNRISRAASGTVLSEFSAVPHSETGSNARGVGRGKVKAEGGRERKELHGRSNLYQGNIDMLLDYEGRVR